MSPPDVETKTDGLKRRRQPSASLSPPKPPPETESQGGTKPVVMPSPQPAAARPPSAPRPTTYKKFRPHRAADRTTTASSSSAPPRPPTRPPRSAPPASQPRPLASTATAVKSTAAHAGARRRPTFVPPPPPARPVAPRYPPAAGPSPSLVASKTGGKALDTKALPKSRENFLQPTPSREESEQGSQPPPRSPEQTSPEAPPDHRPASPSARHIFYSSPILGKTNVLAALEALNTSREPGYEEPTFKAVWGLFGAQGLYDLFLEGVRSVRVWQSLCDTGDVENLRSAGDPVTAASNDKHQQALCLKLWTLPFTRVDAALGSLQKTLDIERCRKVVVTYIQSLTISILSMNPGSIVAWRLQLRGVQLATLDPRIRPANRASGLVTTGEVTAAIRSRPGSAASNRESEVPEETPEIERVMAYQVAATKTSNKDARSFWQLLGGVKRFTAGKDAIYIFVRGEKARKRLATRLNLEKVPPIAIPVPVQEVLTREELLGEDIYFKLTDARASRMEESKLVPESLQFTVFSAAGTAQFTYGSEKLSDGGRDKLRLLTSWLQVTREALQAGASVEDDDDEQDDDDQGGDVEDDVDRFLRANLPNEPRHWRLHDEEDVPVTRSHDDGCVRPDDAIPAGGEVGTSGLEKDGSRRLGERGPADYTVMLPAAETSPPSQPTVTIEHFAPTRDALAPSSLPDDTLKVSDLYAGSGAPPASWIFDLLGDTAEPGDACGGHPTPSHPAVSTIPALDALVPLSLLSVAPEAEYTAPGAPPKSGFFDLLGDDDVLGDAGHGADPIAPDQQPGDLMPIKINIVPEVPDIPQVPGVLDMSPGVPNVPGVSEAPDVLDVPRVPTQANLPGSAARNRTLTVEQEVLRLRTQRTEDRTRITSLEGEVADLKSEVAYLKGGMEDMKGEMAELRAAMEALLKRE